ncbi:MAG: hypothetical protein ACI9XU_001093, partial [Arenicella sp.]
MNLKIKFVLLLIAAAFAGGMYLGKSNAPAPTITSSTGGASYQGGYNKETDQSLSDNTQSTAVQGVAATTETTVIIVKDGES